MREPEYQYQQEDRNEESLLERKEINHQFFWNNAEAHPAAAPVTFPPVLERIKRNAAKLLNKLKGNESKNESSEAVSTQAVPNAADQPAKTGTVTPEHTEVIVPYAVQPASDTETYTVQAGDTLLSVAEKYGITAERLLELNPQLTVMQNIPVGYSLVVPKVTDMTPVPEEKAGEDVSAVTNEVQEKAEEEVTSTEPDQQEPTEVKSKPDEEKIQRWKGMSLSAIIRENGWSWSEVMRLYRLRTSDSEGVKSGVYKYIKQQILDGWTPQDGTPLITHWTGDDGITIIKAWKFDLAGNYARTVLGMVPDTGQTFRWYKSYYSDEANRSDKRNLFAVQNKPFEHEADYIKAKNFNVPFKGDFWEFHDKYGTFENYLAKAVYADRQANDKKFVVYDNSKTKSIGIVKNRAQGENKGVRLRKSPYTEVDKGYVEAEENFIRWLKFNEKVIITAYSKEHGWYMVETESGEIGYAGSDYIESNLPEPGAKYHHVKEGEGLLEIARKYYPNAGDQRNFVNEIIDLNKGAGIYRDVNGDNYEDQWTELKNNYENNSPIRWKQHKVKANFLIWIPGKEYAKQQIANKMPDQRYGGPEYTPEMIKDFVSAVKARSNGGIDPYYDGDDVRDEITNDIKNDWSKEVWGDDGIYGHGKKRWYDIWSSEFEAAGWAAYDKERRLEIERKATESFNEEQREKLQRSNPNKEYSDAELQSLNLETIKKDMMASWFSEAEKKALQYQKELTAAYEGGVEALVQEGKVKLDELMGPGAEKVNWKAKIMLLDDKTFANKISKIETIISTFSSKMLMHPLTGQRMEPGQDDEEYDKFMAKVKAREQRLASNNNYKGDIENMLIGAYARYQQADRMMDYGILSQRTDFWGKPIGPVNYVKPRNTVAWDDPARDKVLGIREKYYDVKAEVLVLARAYFLNIDPATLKRTGFWGSLWEGLAESTFWTEWETNQDMIEQFAQAAAEHGVPLSKSQHERLEKLFIEKAGTVIGAAIPEMLKIIATTFLTEGLGTIPAIARAGQVLKGALTTRFGKFGARLYTVLSSTVKEMTTYAIADAGMWAGLGEGMSQAAFSQVNPFRFRSKFLTLFTTYLFKTASGTVMQTVSEFAGEFTENLVNSGFTFREAFKKTFGETRDDFSEKLLLTVFVSTMFSSASNVKLFMNLRYAVQKTNMEPDQKSKALEMLVSAINQYENPEQAVREEAQAFADNFQGEINEYNQSYATYGKDEVKNIQEKLLSIKTRILVNPEQALTEMGNLRQQFAPYRRFREDLEQLQKKDPNQQQLYEQGLQNIYNDIEALRQQLHEHRKKKLKDYGKVMDGTMMALLPPTLINKIFQVGVKVYHIVSIKGKISYKMWEAEMRARDLGIDFNDPEIQKLLLKNYESYENGDVKVEADGEITYVRDKEEVLLDEGNPDLKTNQSDKSQDGSRRNVFLPKELLSLLWPINHKIDTPQEGEQFMELEVAINDGKLWVKDGTKQGKDHWRLLYLEKGKEAFSFIITLTGELKIGYGHYFLSNSAKAVLAAGSIEVHAGKITYINNGSGHYMPTVEEIQNTIEVFRNINLLAPDLRTHFWKPKK